MNYGLTEINGSPAPQPVLSLQEARKHLRVDIDAEDALIEALVLAATRHAEQYTSRVLVARSFRLSMDGFPPSYGSAFAPRWGNPQNPNHFPEAIYLPLAPLASVEQIQYASTQLGGSPAEPVLQTVEGQLDLSSLPPRIVPLYGQSWPSTACVPQAVQVTFTAGYGEPNDVPEDIKAAVKLVLGSLFEHREDNVVGTITAELPLGAKALLAPYRLFL